MPEAIAVAQRLKAYRKKQHKTQFEMGAEMGLSEETISKIERGLNSNMKLDTLQKISAHMGVTVSELVDVEGGKDDEKYG